MRAVWSWVPSKYEHRRQGSPTAVEGSSASASTSTSTGDLKQQTNPEFLRHLSKFQQLMIVGFVIKIQIFIWSLNINYIRFSIPSYITSKCRIGFGLFNICQLPGFFGLILSWFFGCSHKIDRGIGLCRWVLFGLYHLFSFPSSWFVNLYAYFRLEWLEPIKVFVACDLLMMSYLRTTLIGL